MTNEYKFDALKNALRGDVFDVKSAADQFEQGVRLDENEPRPILKLVTEYGPKAGDFGAVKPVPIHDALQPRGGMMGL